MMHRLLIGITLSAFGILVMSIGGCRAVHVTKIDPSSYEAGDTLPGVVYYKPEPYLRVIVAPKKDANGRVVGKETKVDVLYLPNMKHAYAINSDVSGGQNTLDLTLENGWNLTGLKGTTDPQIDEGIEALAEVVGSFQDEALTGDESSLKVDVYLIHVRMNKKGKLKLGPAVPVEFPNP